MRRREFLGLAAGVLAAGSGKASPNRKVLLICMDGCGPEYLERSDMPNFRRMAGEGMFKIGRSVMPSVTNVNNSSIATGSFPEDHGITANYYWDRATRKGTYMESPEFLLRPTVFSKAREAGYRTAFVSAKDKLRELLGTHADVAISAEKTPAAFQSVVGPAPDVYSPDLNYWSFRAVRQLFRQGFNFIYLATTDYMMHTYAPEQAPSLGHMHQVDGLLGSILDDHPGLELYFTADHGMSAKTRALDLKRLLARQSIDVEAVPIIKDRYVKHHENLGGSCYVFLQDTQDLLHARRILEETPGVEQVLDQVQAASRFHLMADRIGDLMVLGTGSCAFGDLDHIEEEAHVRTHGSLHESAVPILCYGRKVNADDYEYNLDIVRRFTW